MRHQECVLLGTDSGLYGRLCGPLATTNGAESGWAKSCSRNNQLPHLSNCDVNATLRLYAPKDAFVSYIHAWLRLSIGFNNSTRFSGTTTGRHSARALSFCHFIDKSDRRGGQEIAAADCRCG
jgi:hypothetical protein